MEESEVRMRLRWKIVIFLLGVLAGAFLARAEDSCQLVAVEWSDAVIRVKTKAEVKDEDLLVRYLSFGCLRETTDAWVIVHSFEVTNGALRAEDYLAIPKGWTTKITKLKSYEEETDPPKPSSESKKVAKKKKGAKATVVP